MISQTVEYALRAVASIAQHEGRPCTAKKIAEITQVPLPYLSKLMQGLVRGGVVNSQRGPYGGFVLTKDPRDLTILDVVNVVEPIKRIRECPLKIHSHGKTLCPLHRRLDQAIEATETIFRETTLDEMLSKPDGVTPLCEEMKMVPLGIASPKKKKAKRKWWRRPRVVSLEACRQSPPLVNRWTSLLPFPPTVSSLISTVKRTV